MDSLIVGEVLKAGGLIQTTIAAIYAVYADKLEKVEDGKLTKKGKVLILTAVGGLAVSLAAQLAQYAAALDSAEIVRKKNEETSAKLSNVAIQLQQEALAATPLRRLTYITYFARGTPLAQITDKSALAVDVTFVRGSQSEFRIELSPSPNGRVTGIVQLEGRDQRVAAPLQEAMTYGGVHEKFRWHDLETPSLWVDLGFNKVVSTLRQSSDGRFDYWPYRSVADLKDVWLYVEVKGTMIPRIEASFLRLNEDLVITLPPIVDGHMKMTSLISNIRVLSNKI